MVLIVCTWAQTSVLPTMGTLMGSLMGTVGLLHVPYLDASFYT
jgi:hypothetical protein